MFSTTNTFLKSTKKMVNNLTTFSKTVNIICVPFSGGQQKQGTDIAPQKIIESGLLYQLQKLGWTVIYQPSNDFQAFKPKSNDFFGKMKNVEYTSKVCKDVYDRVSSTCSNGHFPLVLGGDHSIAIGSISGTIEKYPDIGVIWVDAHADINTLETTESGNLHGCPVSFLMGLGSKVPQFSWVKPSLKPSKIVYIGLRDVEAGERKILADNNIKCYSMYEIDKHGIGKVVEMALNYLGDCPIHLSFDIDSFDPLVAPATGTPVRGGLTFREGQ
jgi:arginase